MFGHGWPPFSPSSIPDLIFKVHHRVRVALLDQDEDAMNRVPTTVIALFEQWA
jgi:hypothetical protein